MLTIKSTKKFKQDLKRILRQGLNVDFLNEAVTKLANQEKLDEKYQDHALKGEWIGFRECHIAPNWLLIYRINNEELILTLTRTGSHSDLFE